MSPRRAPAAGALPERYKVLGLAGRGEFSEVLRVRDRVLGCELALKRFSGAAGGSEQMLADEFLLLAQLGHPNLPRVHDFALDAAGRPFITMDFLAGPALGEVKGERWRAARGPRGYAAFLARCAARILSALAHIHARGVIHGDVKPSNILFASRRGGVPRDEDIRLVDFGLGGAIAQLSGRPFGGTPRYMSPEVKSGAAPDPPSDLYSLGKVFEEALRASGRRREDGAEAGALAGVAERLSAELPSNRYRSADAACWDVLAVLEEIPDPAVRGLRRNFVFSAQPRCWDAPVAALCERIDAAREGRGGAVVAAGVRGGPARRLAAELRARALTRGLAAVRVTAAPGAGRESIEAALLAAAETVAGAHRRGTRAAGGASSPSRPSTTAPRLVEASQGLGAASVWILDEAERLHPDHLRPLGHLAFALRSAPVLVIAVGPGEGAAGAAGCAGQDLVVFPEPRQEDIEEVLTSSFGRIEPLGPLARTLLESTGGDVETLGVTLEHLVREGALSRGRGSWVADVVRVRKAGPRRARHDPPLPAAAADRAARLALLKGAFDEESAAAACGLRSPDAARLLALMCGIGLLRRIVSPGEAARWELTAAAAAEDLARRIPAAERRQVHRRLLVRLDRRGGGADREARAWHLAGAGRPAEAAAEHLEAGSERMRAHDLLGACGHLEKALALAPASDSGLVRLVRYRLALALQAAGHFEESRAHLETLLKRARRPEGVEAADLLLAQARNLEALGRHAESQDLLERALAGSRPEDHARRARALRASGWVAFLDGDLERGFELERSARREARAGGDPGALASVQSLLGHLLRMSGRLEEAEAAFRSAIEGHLAAGDLVQAASDRNNLGVVWIRRDPERARAILREAASECARIGSEYHLASVLMNLTIVEKARGEWDAAERDCRAAIDIGERLGLPELHRPYMNLGTLLTDRGAFEDARGCFDRCAALLERRSGTHARSFLTLNRARWALRREQPEEALALLDTAARDLSERTPQTWMNLHFYRAEALAALGRAEEARRAAETAQRAAAKQDDETFKGEAFMYRAVAEKAAGNHEAAAALLDEAGRLFERCGQAVFEARVRLARAELPALDVGAARKGLEEASAAVDTFERLGAAPFLSRSLRARRVHEETLRRSADAPRELQTLYRAAQLCAAVEKLPELLEGLLDAAISLLGAERGLIFLRRDGGGGELVRVASRRLAPAEEADVLRISRGILSRALRDDAPILCADATLDLRFSSRKSVICHQIRSLICAPLRSRDAAIGTIYVDHAQPGKFTEKDAQFLLALASFAAPAIELARGRVRSEHQVEGLREEVRELREKKTAAYQPASLIGGSTGMKDVKALVGRCAGAAFNVLIVGETGTGKDHVANVIHYSGPRAAQPFVVVPCALLEGGLVDSTLFGIVGGAATDVAPKAGKFEIAHGGTLYLDEIGALPQSTQAKMLRVLEDRYVERIGATSGVFVDVRILAASSVDPSRLVKEGRLRQDLYYRLNVLTIELPPLRERREDLPALLGHFIARACEEQGRAPLRIPREVLREYQGYAWPGNLWELKHNAERAVLEAAADELPPLRGRLDLLREAAESVVQEAAAGSLSLRAMQAAYARLMLDRCGGHKMRAARTLGINYRTLMRLLGRRRR